MTNAQNNHIVVGVLSSHPWNCMFAWSQSSHKRIQMNIVFKSMYILYEISQKVYKHPMMMKVLVSFDYV